MAESRAPRILRSRVPHESTGVEGRGTEEVKTNDVSGRVKMGEVGFTIELGRPGVGVRFRRFRYGWDSAGPASLSRKETRSRR